MLSVGFFTQGAIPIPVPSRTDAFVTLSASKQSLLTDCQSNNDHRDLKYLGRDDTGDMEHMDYFIDRAITDAGCDPPLMTHLPSNGSIPCPPFLLQLLRENYHKPKEELAKEGKERMVCNEHMVLIR